jgi:hypothetical protein
LSARPTFPGTKAFDFSNAGSTRSE